MNAKKSETENSTVLCQIDSQHQSTVEKKAIFESDYRIFDVYRPSKYCPAW